MNPLPLQFSSGSPTASTSFISPNTETGIHRPGQPYSTFDAIDSNSGHSHPRLYDNATCTSSSTTYNSSSTLRLALSDPTASVTQYTFQPNIATNMERFASGSPTPFHAYNHEPTSFRFSGTMSNPLTALERYDGHEVSNTHSTQGDWGLPFLDQTGSETVQGRMSTGHRWINPLDAVVPQQRELNVYTRGALEVPAFMHAPDKSASGSHQIIRPSPSLPLRISSQYSPPLNMAIQQKQIPPQPQTIVAPLPTPAVITSIHEDTQTPEPDETSRTKLLKKHGCWMCHKSFDRPSTLRKHLLVHTGEKAFVCDSCGRRFGVNSNLNRHMKRCVLRNASPEGEDELQVPDSVSPESSTRPATATSQSTAPEPIIAAPDPISNPAHLTQSQTTGSKKRRSKSKAKPSSTTEGSDQHIQSSPKRPRRPPSPNQWVPASLLAFNLFPIECTKSTPVPLPPVSAYKDPRTNEWVEERDSWDENVGATPYHPSAWKGRLPGPGLGFGGKDVGNLGTSGGGGSEGGGYVMGRLILTR